MKPTIIIFLFILFFVQAMPAQEGPTVRVDSNTYGFAAITVADIVSSAIWYQKHFGLTKGFSYTATDKSVQILILSTPGLTIELQQHSTALPLQSPTGKAFLRHGIFKYGISVVDVKGAVAMLEAIGTKIVVAPFEDQEGRFLSAIISDNSGNLIQLFQKISKNSN